jgi:hypothetical protein
LINGINTSVKAALDEEEFNLDDEANDGEFDNEDQGSQEDDNQESDDVEDALVAPTQFLRPNQSEPPVAPEESTKQTVQFKFAVNSTPSASVETVKQAMQFSFPAHTTSSASVESEILSGNSKLSSNIAATGSSTPAAASTSIVAAINTDETTAKLLQRAARFGIPPAPPVQQKLEEVKKNARATRFGIQSTSTTSSDPVVDENRLKKRIERFGPVAASKRPEVQKIVKEAEKEKLDLRKKRFQLGGNLADLQAEQEK